MNNDYLLTSESVSPGHPDKIADQISDGILDAIMEQDHACRVACETVLKSGMVLVAGEITTTAWVDIESIVRTIIRSIGYTDPVMGFEANTCAVLSAITKQSPDIAQGVNRKNPKKQGAGDQGLMFGYACNDTEVLMPAPIIYAHRIMQKQAELLHKKVLPWLRPDAKSQVSLQYKDGKPFAAKSIVVSTQHSPDIAYRDLVEAVIEEIIKPVMPKEWINKDTKFFVNPTGKFVIGGPISDTGLTGRKIIVDTYGGIIPHGGGCFSGKDPSKVDRSGSYAMRYVAKNIVAAGIAEKCEVQIAYAIGVADPLAINVNTFGTGKISDNSIIALINKHFDLTPSGITTTLNLLRPIYRKTATFGHFGREDKDFTWEMTDKAAALKKAAKV